MEKHYAAKKPMSFLVLQVLLVSTLLLLPVAECQSSQGGSANLTVTGTVFCDACSSSSFSNHSYFLPGVRVRIDCMFRASSTSKEEMKITAEKTTNNYGAYQLDIPAIDGLGCTTGGQTTVSFCRAAVLDNPSALCNVPALATTAGHISFSTQAQEPNSNSNSNVCIFNLNSLYYRTRPNKGSGLCDDGGGPLQPAVLNASLFYCPRWPWPPIPFCTPHPWFPPIPFFTPPPPAFPFLLPPIPFFTPPSPPPPAFPFNLPHWPWTPRAPAPPSFPFPHLPPIFSALSPPPPLPLPPAFPFPNLPPFPHLPPFAFPPLSSVYSPPPPPPPSFPWPFPPLPFSPPMPPSPSAPSPPPLKRSRKDPSTWSSSKTTP